MRKLIIETVYGLFTCQYFFDAGVDEGLECKSEEGEIVTLSGEALIEEVDFDTLEEYQDEINRLEKKIEQEYENEFL